MKMLFESYWWMQGPVSNRQILRDVVRTWIREFPEDEVTVAVRKRDRDRVAIELPSARIVTSIIRPQGLSAILELPFLARRTNADITLSNNFTPFMGRSAVFIQDMLFMNHPEWFTFKERIYFRLMPWSALRAEVIFSSSAVEGGRMRGLIRGHPRVESVGLGLSSDLLAALPSQPDAELNAASFLLTVGRLNVRKNLENVCLGAIQSGQLSDDFPLVVVGEAQGRSTSFSPETWSAINDGRIVLLGSVSNSELAWLYSNTASFLFMTLGEGFGLPPLEALAFGAPVIVSDLPVMREVLGTHARYVNPLSTTAIADAVVQVAAESDQEPASERKDYARSRYNWADTVSSMRGFINGSVRSGKAAR